MRWLVILALAACEGGGGGGGTGAKETVKPNLPVAKPAPTWCDGKKCPCAHGTEKAKDWSDACSLSKDLVVQGVPCGKDWPLEFFPDGRFHNCSVTSELLVGDYHCAVGMGRMYLHHDGSLERCYLKPDGELEFGGYRLAADFGGMDFETYSRSKLKEGRLARPTKIGKHMCSGKIVLYPDGNVFSCDAEEPVVVDGTLTLDKKTPVIYATDGSLAGFFPQKPVTYKGEKKDTGWAVCIVKDCNTSPPSSDD